VRFIDKGLRLPGGKRTHELLPSVFSPPSTLIHDAIVCHLNRMAAAPENRLPRFTLFVPPFHHSLLDSDRRDVIQ